MLVLKMFKYVEGAIFSSAQIAGHPTLVIVAYHKIFPNCGHCPTLIYHREAAHLEKTLSRIRGCSIVHRALLETIYSICITVSLYASAEVGSQPKFYVQHTERVKGEHAASKIENEYVVSSADIAAGYYRQIHISETLKRQLWVGFLERVFLYFGFFLFHHN